MDNNLELERKQEKHIFEILKDSKDFKIVGRSCFILSANWFQAWENYLYNEGEKPSTIDNSVLIKTFPAENTLNSENLLILRDNLHEGIDFNIIDKTTWESLIKWYKGGPEIKRFVIEEGETKETRVEISLFRFIILKTTEKWEVEECKNLAFYRSKQTTLQKIFRDLCKHFQVDERQVRLWNAYDPPNYEIFTSEQLNKSVHELQLVTGQKLLLEIQTENGVWPISRERGGFYSRYVKPIFDYTLSFFYSTSESMNAVASSFTIPTLYGSGKGSEKGICGLSNLGNTCFMNSALQCLSHTPPLTLYFLSNAYIEHINKENPLGTKGNLAEQYALLIKALWSGDYSHVAPKNLKWAIGKFAPRFSGYAQQDSQELLAYLLDGLHEDLNQIKQKPYVTIEDSNDRSDEEVSQEHWEKHLMRNKSIIVDKFQAQLKSKLVCPNCSKVSITFDPFMYLSLPLPSTMEVVSFTVCSFDSIKKPTRYSIQLPKYSKILELRAKISQLTNIKIENVVIIEINNSRISSILKDNQIVSNRVDDFYVYDLDSDEKYDEFSYLPVAFRKNDDSSKTSSYTRTRKKLFGTPLLTIAKKTCNTLQLYAFIWMKVQRFLRSEFMDPKLPQITTSSPNETWKLVQDFVNSSIDNDNNFDTSALPFTLHYCSLTVMFCVKCKSSNCSGCEIKPSDKPVKWFTNMSISIDWKDDAFELFQDSSFSFNIHPSVNEMKELSNKSISLFDCLNLFCKTEILSEEDKWYCSTCKDFVRATKKMDLWTTPEILIIHLKRFQSTSRGFREKIDVSIDFPTENLDLSEFVLNENAKKPIYDLYAISVHSGSLHSGHYTAIARSDNDKKWYNFNDSSVSQTKKIPTKGAYILFYRRRDIDNDNDSMVIDENDENRIELCKDVIEEVMEDDDSKYGW